MGFREKSLNIFLKICMKESSVEFEKKNLEKTLKESLEKYMRGPDAFCQIWVSILNNSSDFKILLTFSRLLLRCFEKLLWIRENWVDFEFCVWRKIGAKLWASLTQKWYFVTYIPLLLAPSYGKLLQISKEDFPNKFLGEIPVETPWESFGRIQ